MEIVNKFHEMIALNKALNYVRFTCTASEVQELIFSETIVSMHLRLIDNLRIEYAKEGIEIPEDFGYIEDEGDYFNVIIAQLRNLNSWHKLDDKAKKEIILLMIKPYRIKEVSVNYLINYK